MTFVNPEYGTGTNLTESLFQASLPRAICNACGDTLQRREPRVFIRATWRTNQEQLCRGCWRAITEWASRFALHQMELPLA